MEYKRPKANIYVPHIITDREEASKYVYDWYNWPKWRSIISFSM